MQPLGMLDPETIGPYRLRARLGVGGMGQVYLGMAANGRFVAIKVVHPGLAHDERFRARFRREVEVSRRVTGPWVAAVVDADPDAEQPWLATQYVRGPSLGTAVEALGPLPASTVHVLAHGLAVALRAIHEVGLVHRDLKPTNVLLDADHPRVIDFGISRAADGTRMTSTGAVIGTPAFMSPEQIAGVEVGPASDVFSLGSVLFYAVTGRSPFGDGAPVALMMRISQQEPDLDAVPTPLRGVVEACLAKRPADRPDAAELGRMLGPVASGATGWLPPTIAALAPGLPQEPPTRPNAEPGPGPGPGQVAERHGVSRRKVLLTTIGAGVTTAAGAWGVIALDPAPPDPAPPVPEVRWRVPFADADGGRPVWAVDPDTLYTSAEQGVIRALDGASGAERWRADVAAYTLIPHDGILVVSTLGSLAALDPATGHRLWDMPHIGPHRSIDVSNWTVVAVLMEGDASDPLGVPVNVVALDVATGARLWTGERYEFSGDLRPIAGAGSAYYCQGGQLVARELRTGGVGWTVPASVDATAIAATRDLVLVDQGWGGGLEARSTVTGQQQWGVAWQGGSVALAGDMIILQEGDAGDGSAVVVRGVDPRTGTEVWTAPPSRAQARPVSTPDRVYLSLVDGPTCAYDTATGARRWSLEGATPVAAHGNTVYLRGHGELRAVTGR